MKAVTPIHTTSIPDSIEKGLDYLLSLQGEDGSWRGDYGGPMFLLPMYVAACRVAGRRIPEDRRLGMIRYLENTQNPDGSIGLHAEDEGSMFTTALSYVALRLLGVSRDDQTAASMRRWIHENGTALGSASWGKLVLAVLNLYPYEGLNPILPELWAMPAWVPFHPGRMWCHCRQVYLPMAYLYGTKARIPEDDLIEELRYDLYNRPYGNIDFDLHRNTVSPTDDRYPLSRPMRAADKLMIAYEKRCPSFLRRRAVDEVLDHIRYEDKVTSHIDIGPVNSVLNAMVAHFEDPRSLDTARSFEALDGYIFDTDEGTKMGGYNSTALWDTAFAVQAISSTGPSSVRRRSHALRRAYEYIRNNQVLEDVPAPREHFRHPSKGGWPFSDRAHGWPITDCTAEGFKCALELEGLVDEPIDEELLQSSVELILSWQNRDGGWATYEKQRAGSWMELLNPSQVFADIMVDYSYVECTSACLQALAKAKMRFEGRLRRRIEDATEHGRRFILGKQHASGGWQGSWAVCFTYGTWFGVSGLLAAGEAQNSKPIRDACGFLIARQNPDGGWGERKESCFENRYVRDDDSRAVQTAWALSTLVRAGLAHSAVARRAADHLMRSQTPSGDWPKEPLVGVFNKTALINYENYRRYFPIWALAEYHRAVRL